MKQQQQTRREGEKKQKTKTLDLTHDAAERVECDR